MNKITEQDLANRGVKGLPDVPGLTTEEMQRKLEEIAREILIPKVNELVEGLNNANSNLNNTNLQTLQSASSNGIISNALYLDLNSAYGVSNRPCMVTADKTTDMPSDCAWGIREVLFMNENMVAVRITGVKTGGTESKIWTNCYNYGTWTGWV